MTIVMAFSFSILHLFLLDIFHKIAFSDFPVSNHPLFTAINYIFQWLLNLFKSSQNNQTVHNVSNFNASRRFRQLIFY